ncbi:hypothetical protein [Arcobacter aquimarinus]|uniref:DinB-like domain-containing protein n=1 Tax=Arcobacter aquimarinus TaxID=1315211 RepID=A0AAE7B171_9BACT|nr:hypothetical protein [Arcobacter aquimarinus]QKE25603.1 hypothetical protein AAQM_0840 [Arcobacter aquimarinus]RXI30497.1 hypothetical protein CP986_11855 [Arcobacter aquimarinus]
MKLAPPGSGLPNFERLFIKNVLVPSIRILITWNIALYLLQRELKIIDKLVKSLDEELLIKKIIIDRTFAIEDDTRQFSINMVLEHLEIAGNKIKNVIETLSLEKEFIEDIKIENVKPKQNANNQYKSFKNFYQEYISFIKALDKKQSQKKKKHPWFVEFNNYDWSVFMYMHRRQIEAIIKEIK